MWLIFAFAAAAFWGLNYSLNEKILAYDISPITLLIIEGLIGVILFLPIGFYGQLKSDVMTIASIPKLFWLTSIDIFVFNLASLLIFLSIQARNATLAGLIELCYPIFTVIFTYFLFREHHINLPIIIGACLILGGAAIISYFS